MRRLCINLITCYKVVHGLVSIPFGSFFEFGTHRGTRCHPLKLFCPDPRVRVRAHCFPIRVIVLWNRHSPTIHWRAFILLYGEESKCPTQTCLHFSASRLSRGMTIRLAKKRQYTLNDVGIKACLRRFDDNVYTKLEFLKAVSHMQHGRAQL